MLCNLQWQLCHLSDQKHYADWVTTSRIRYFTMYMGWKGHYLYIDLPLLIQNIWRFTYWNKANSSQHVGLSWSVYIKEYVLNVVMTFIYQSTGAFYSAKQNCILFCNVLVARGEYGEVLFSTLTITATSSTRLHTHFG